MSTTTTPEAVLRKVADIASLAGFKVGPHPQVANMLVCGFDMGGGRTQTVYIAPCGKLPDGSDVIAFQSPCMALKKGLLTGMSRKTALDLLTRNGNLGCGAFCIENFGEIDVLCVRSTQIVDTMEVEEFSLHVSAVAVIADEYERENGTDVF